MIGAVICNGSNTMVADLPAPSLDLENKLHSIVIIPQAMHSHRNCYVTTKWFHANSRVHVRRCKAGK